MHVALVKVMGHGSEKTEQARAAAGDAQDYAHGKAKDAHKYAKDSAEYAQAKANEAAEQGGSTWQKVKDGASQAYDSVSLPAPALHPMVYILPGMECLLRQS